MKSPTVRWSVVAFVTALFVLAACAPSVASVSPPLLLDSPSASAPGAAPLGSLPQQIMVIVVTPTPIAGSEGASGGQVALASGQDQTSATTAENQGQGAQNQAAGSSSESSTASSSPSQMSDQELISTGEQVFTSECASCHGENGQGGGDYPALAGNPFVTSEDLSGPLNTVLHGRGQMPSFSGQLSDQQLAGVLSYIRNSWGNNASVVHVDQVSQGGGESAAGSQQVGDQGTGGDQAQAGGQQADGQQQATPASQEGAAQARPTAEATAEATQGVASSTPQTPGPSVSVMGVGENAGVITIQIQIMIVTPEASTGASAGENNTGAGGTDAGGAGATQGQSTPSAEQVTPSAEQATEPASSVGEVNPTVTSESGGEPKATPTPQAGGGGTPQGSNTAQGTSTPEPTPASTLTSTAEAQALPTEAQASSSGGVVATAVTGSAVGGEGQAAPLTLQIMIMVATPQAQDTAQATGESFQAAGGAQVAGEGQTSGESAQGSEPTPAAGVEQGGEDSSPSTEDSQSGESGEQGALSGQQLVDRGGAVYTARCAACHQEGGTGIEGVYPPLANNPYVTAENPEQVLQVVLTGRGGMPHFGEYLSTEELAAVVSYVRNAWGNSAPTVTPEQVGEAVQQFAAPREVVEH